MTGLTQLADAMELMLMAFLATEAPCAWPSEGPSQTPYVHSKRVPRGAMPYRAVSVNFVCLSLRGTTAWSCGSFSDAPVRVIAIF